MDYISGVIIMKLPFKIVKTNKEVRTQGSLVPMGETSRKGNYISNIIKNHFYDYYDINHRVAVCKLDGKAKRLTYIWADRCVAKTFKFYSSHEVDGVEVMQEQRARWIELNCKEIFKKAIVPFNRDGYVLLDLIKKLESIDYNVYGEFECPPKLWTRGPENVILAYKAQYTPKPRAMGTSAPMLEIANPKGDNLRAINRTYSAKELIHIERGEPNDGCGDPLIEAAWDSLIKLCGESHQEMLDRRSIPTLHLTEDDYDEGDNKAKGLLKMVANSDADTARVWYHTINDKREITDYPMFAYESPTTNKNYTQRNEGKGVASGDYGNISNEWANLCTLTGHTIHYFIGNRAGAVVGSETDQWDDIQQEIVDFGLCEIIIRKILNWLESKDLITIPKEPFVIKYWRDWEKIEREVKLKEEMQEQAQMKQTQGQDIEAEKQDNEPRENKINQAIFKDIINCIKNNMSYAMTDVMSSWIDQIGYDDVTDLLYGIFTGVSYSKPAPMGEWSFLDWEDAGSKGRYFWDYLSQRDPPWQRATIPDKLLTHFVAVKTNPFAGYKDFADCVAKNQDKDDPEAYCGKIKHKTENKENYEFIKIPMPDYKLIDQLDTETKIKRLARSDGWSMGTSTASSIKKMLNSLKNNANKHQLRYNTMTAEAFGNSIKEHHPLLYDIGNGFIVEEYICPESWKKNVGKTVPLGVYHNLEQDIPELPDWQIVGTAEIFGWDDEDGYDYVKYNYDYDKIDQVFKKLGEPNWLRYVLKENGKADQSTAYYCDIEIQWSDRLQKFIRVQTNIDLKSISFVPKGNCPGEICSLTVIKRNASQLQIYIKECIAEGIEKDQCLAKAYAKFKK